MFKIEIELPESITFSRGSRRNNVSVEKTVDLRKLPLDMIAALVEHGIVQKVGDAASGKETEAEIDASMQKVLDALMAGNWGVARGAGESEDFRIAKRLINAAYMGQAKDDAKRVEWEALDDDAAAERVRGILADPKFGPIWAEKVEAEKKRLAADRKRREELRKQMGDLGL